jgi:hypothetical protein
VDFYSQESHYHLSEGNVIKKTHKFGIKCRTIMSMGAINKERLAIPRQMQLLQEEMKEMFRGSIRPSRMMLRKSPIGCLHRNTMPWDLRQDSFLERYRILAGMRAALRRSPAGDEASRSVRIIPE